MTKYPLENLQCVRPQYYDILLICFFGFPPSSVVPLQFVVEVLGGRSHVFFVEFLTPGRIFCLKIANGNV